MPGKDPQQTPNGNGTALLAHVFTEQLRALTATLDGHRAELRGDIKDLKLEVIERAKHHEEADVKAFKAIDDRLGKFEQVKAGEDAVARYRKWQLGVVAAAGATLIWNVGKNIEPVLQVISKILNGP